MSRVRTWWHLKGLPALQSGAMGLAILGILAVLRGVSYLPIAANPGRQPAHWLEGLASPPWWACVWIAAGLLCLITVWFDRAQPTAVGIILGLHAAWALSFLGMWAMGEHHRGWVSALNYAAIVALALWAWGRGQRREYKFMIDSGG